MTLCTMSHVIPPPKAEINIEAPGNEEWNPPQNHQIPSPISLLDKTVSSFLIFPFTFKYIQIHVIWFQPWPEDFYN